MGRRWKLKEEEALNEVKRILKEELASRPQFPDVVGDRRIIRFLRGNSLKVDATVKAIRAHFKWRDENEVDEVRQDILYGGKNEPNKFPMAELILGIAPQIIISANALDKKGRPLAMETFDFSPKEMFEAVTIKEYLHFLIYTLEYRALVLEQMSHERETAYLREHPTPESREEGYGVTVMDYTIRDLKGVGVGHLGSKGRALVAAALEAALPNYPEFLERCVMINTPWVFNTFWYFVKGLLDDIILQKLAMCGTTYMPTLLDDFQLENIPECIGGKFKLFNEPFSFDLSVGGPLYYPGAPPGPKLNKMENKPNSPNAVAQLFPEADTGVTSSTLNSLLAPPTMQRSISGGSAVDSADKRPRSSSGSALGRVPPSRRPASTACTEALFTRAWKHLTTWVTTQPVKVLLTILGAGVFVWIRITGWLQPMVYPAIVYATLFDTTPVLRMLMSHFDIDYRLHSGRCGHP